MIKVGIVGSTGYGGCELVRLLLSHKDAKIVWVSSRTYSNEEYSDVYGSYFTLLDQKCVDENLKDYLDEVDVVFFATPQGVCASMIDEEVLSKVKVIDLSADFRIKDVNVYEKWYKIKHPTPQFIDEAVYGLCEVNRDKIENTRLLANPGCFTTCSILSVYPLAKNHLIDMSTLIVDAKSGTSGAGRGAKVQNLFCEVNESIKAYGVASHRHTPEIEEQLSYASNEDVLINFTPHLIPMNRGILITAYASLNKGVTKEDIDKAYSLYQDEYFIRVLKEGVNPEVRNVRGSNFTDINYVIDKRTNRIVIMGVIDNLVKGAAGQAIQNMNIMFNLDEKEGLMLAPSVL
ncbi:MAG: N-acetyl-gamma-glutamyl-phosphate reductase [Thomasclavelia sp.]|jgi:N-acetyl-gamma-glutamyl-phosphate reductase|nr:N-acetyl-gamma-glutamyl-phosphate reductase [Thomasclavelia sp.]